MSSEGGRDRGKASERGAARGSGERRSDAQPVRQRTRKRGPERSSEDRAARGGDAKAQPTGGDGKPTRQKKKQRTGGGGGQAEQRKRSRNRAPGRGRGRGGNRSQGGGGGQRRGRGGDLRAFWGDASALPAASTDVRITDDEHAVPRSLGEPPLPQQREIAEHYFAAVYDRAVAAAGALAAAGGLIGIEELHDARSGPDSSD